MCVNCNKCINDLITNAVNHTLNSYQSKQKRIRRIQTVFNVSPVALFSYTDSIYTHVQLVPIVVAVNERTLPFCFRFTGAANRARTYTRTNGLTVSQLQE